MQHFRRAWHEAFDRRRGAMSRNDQAEGSWFYIRCAGHAWLGFATVGFWVAFLSRLDTPLYVMACVGLFAVLYWHVRVMGVLQARIGIAIGEELVNRQALSTRLGAWIDSHPRLAMTPMLTLELLLVLGFATIMAES
ncbi:MAG: hypothetical protein ACLFRV_10875 [Acidimicrobiales bacterium]